MSSEIVCIFILWYIENIMKYIHAKGDEYAYECFEQIFSFLFNLFNDF